MWASIYYECDDYSSVQCTSVCIYYLYNISDDDCDFCVVLYDMEFKTYVFHVTQKLEFFPACTLSTPSAVDYANFYAVYKTLCVFAPKSYCKERWIPDVISHPEIIKSQDETCVPCTAYKPTLQNLLIQSRTDKSKRGCRQVV